MDIPTNLFKKIVSGFECTINKLSSQESMPW